MDLTAPILTTALAERNPGVRVANVNVVETSVYGSQQVSTADRVTLELDYAHGADVGLPARMLLKTFIDRPHAPHVMYRTEERFYREIRPQLSIETPAAYGSLVDDEGRSGVLMEDLGLRSARFPNATTTLTLEEVTSLLSTLAALHAQLWNSPRFNDDLAWVPTPLGGGMYETFTSIGLEIIRDQLRHEFKAKLLAPLGHDLDELWDALWRAQEIIDSAPVTLLHGDTHVGNTYLLPDGGDGSGGLIDWQLMVRGRWSHDVTYLLTTSLETDRRRAHERELISIYLSELAARGVEAPEPDEAWKLYRLSAIWGLVIGWLITPPQNYGEAITAANVSRLVAAVDDLDSLAALT